MGRAKCEGCPAGYNPSIAKMEEKTDTGAPAHFMWCNAISCRLDRDAPVGFQYLGRDSAEDQIATPLQLPWSESELHGTTGIFSFPVPALHNASAFQIFQFATWRSDWSEPSYPDTPSGLFTSRPWLRAGLSFAHVKSVEQAKRPFSSLHGWPGVQWCARRKPTNYLA